VAAIFAATLNATAFALALGNIEASRHDGDRPGVRTWGAIATAYALLMFVIAVEAILTLSKQAGAAGTLAAMNAPQWLEALALWAFVSSIGLSALLITLTFWRKNARILADDVAARDETVTIRRPVANRIADGIRAARAGREEIGSAWRGDTPRLPQGSPALAKDAPPTADDALMEQADDAPVETVEVVQEGERAQNPQPKRGRK
jgi:hypothetical protein